MEPRLALLLPLAISSMAADFTGHWKLAVSDSDFGKATPPRSQEIVVRQGGDRLEVRSTLSDHRGTFTTEYRLDASGKEVRNQMRGYESLSTASWRGANLHVRSRALLPNAEVLSTDDWSLSPDGNRLTIYRTARTPQGTVEQKFVYERHLDGR